MDLIWQDVFESARYIKEVEGVNKLLIKEASRGNRFNTLEIVTIMIFKSHIFHYLKQMIQKKVLE